MFRESLPYFGDCLHETFISLAGKLVKLRFVFMLDCQRIGIENLDARIEPLEEIVYGKICID